MDILAKYGASLTIPFMLHALDGQSFNGTAVHAAGDTTVMKDEGAETNTTNGFVDEGTGYSLTLTATEMQAARLLLKIDDQSGPKLWLPKALRIWTFGNASAHLVTDFSTDPIRANVTQINNNGTAANNSKNANLAVQSGGVTNTVTPTASKFSTDLTGVDGFWNNSKIAFTTGALLGQKAFVVRFESTNGVVYVTGLTGAPANGDNFVLV